MDQLKVPTDDPVKNVFIQVVSHTKLFVYFSNPREIK